MRFFIFMLIFNEKFPIASDVWIFILYLEREQITMRVFDIIKSHSISSLCSLLWFYFMLQTLNILMLPLCLQFVALFQAMEVSYLTASTRQDKPFFFL